MSDWEGDLITLCKLMKKQSRNLYVNRIEVNDAVSVVDIFEFLQKISKIHKGI
jgi:tRNA (Thr-GGU) A37 N-methylase